MRRTLPLVLLSAATLALFSWLSCSYLGGDEGSYFYEAGLMRGGKVMMKDFVGRAPALMFPLTLWSAVAGDGLLPLKLFNITVVALIAVVVYAIVRRFRPPIVAWLAALVVLLNPTFFLTKLVLNTTALAILFALLACLLLLRDTPRATLGAGALLALAVFTREINAFFVAAILGQALLEKNWTRLRDLAIGGGLVSAVFIGYYAAHIGLAASMRTLLGLGHVGATEARVAPAYSFPKFLFFLVSIAPTAALLLFKEDGTTRGRLRPLQTYLFVTSAFYAVYTFKRGFILAYGSELVPFLAIVIFVTRDLAALRPAKLVPLLAAPLLLFLAVSPPKSKGLLPLDALIGSVIPRASYDAVNAAIARYTDPGETILTGSPVFASANRRRQFLEITRPLIYEGESTLDEMYGAPSREEIIRRFDADKPPIVVLTSHLDASLWRTTGLRDIVSITYVGAYSDAFATVYVRRDVYDKRNP